MPRDMVKCKFCDYVSPKWVGRKGRKPKNGISIVLNHVSIWHSKEYSKYRDENNFNNVMEKVNA